MITASQDDDDFVPLGPREYLDRFLMEYGLLEAELRDKSLVRSRSLRDGQPKLEYSIHSSLLYPHGDFICAGDSEAVEFCNEIATRMVEKFGVTRDTAVSQINDKWCSSGNGRTSSNWVVGLAIVYHEDPDFWADRIYQKD